MRKLIICAVLYCSIAEAKLYNSYTGGILTDKELATYTAAGIVSTCTNDIETCNESDWRRIDGSCNNLQNPTRGCFNTPQIRLIEPEFGDNFEPRLTKSGTPFELARKIREGLLEVGVASDDKFTQLLGFFTEFHFSDYGSIHDIRNYVFETTDCCLESGKSKYMCTPNFIPKYDTVHRFSGQTCLNSTRPKSFQNMGCIANNTVPSRIDFATIFFDLSSVYNFAGSNISIVRALKGGELRHEIVNGEEYPSDGNKSCLIQDAVKTGCTRNVPNGLMGSNLYTTWFSRYHNYVARILAKLNPCWDDDQLFYTTREIVIGFYCQMYYYELLPQLLGKDRLIKRGIISKSTGFRKTYNPKMIPRIAMEYPYAYRSFHTVQDGDQQLYDKEGNFVGTTPVVNNTLRVQDLAINKTFTNITYGAHRQPSGKFDHCVDADMSQVGLGPLQHIFDIPTADLAKGRYFGLARYIKYLDFCTNYTKSHTKFEDLLSVMTKERLEQIKKYYKNVEDVELMAGIWSETLMEGAHVQPTVYCLLVNQLERSMVTDRFWYEQENRPHAFTYGQLQEIRKASMARLLCAVGNDVTHIQPHAFLTISAENAIVNCTAIPSLNLTLWKDDSCDCQ